MTPGQFAKACELYAQIQSMDARLDTFNDLTFDIVTGDNAGRPVSRLSDTLGMDDDYLCNLVAKAVREDIEMSKEAMWEQIKELGIEVQRENYRSNLKLISS